MAENLAIGLERHIELRDHVASFINLPGVVRMEEDVAWTVEDLIELMHLGAFRDKFMRELSTGSRRIVDLAMCIAHDPKVLLLDEPSSGIAQRETEALGPLLQRIQRETGCALLVIEHDMPLITSVSDRIIALELGRPIAEGAPADVIRDPQRDLVLSRRRHRGHQPVGRWQAPQGGHTGMKRLLGAAAIVAALLVGLARPADAIPPSNAGWWWIVQSGAAPVPAPPTVPGGGLMVGGTSSGPNAVAALRFELEADQGSPVLTLAVAENGDINGTEAVVLACPATSAWASTYAGPSAARPASSCAKSVKGVLSADAKTWTFNLTPLQVGNVVNVVLQPGDGSTFNLTFNPPTTTTLATSPKPAPAVSDAASEDATSPIDDAASSAALDLSGIPLDAPAYIAPLSDEIALERADPQQGSPRAQRAPTLAVSDNTTRASGLALVLLLGIGLAACSLSQQPTPAMRALGPMTGTADVGRARRTAAAGPAQIGGLGRFVRPRTGPPPRL